MGRKDKGRQGEEKEKGMQGGQGNGREGKGDGEELVMGQLLRGGLLLRG